MALTYQEEPGLAGIQEWFQQSTFNVCVSVLYLLFTFFLCSKVVDEGLDSTRFLLQMPCPHASNWGALIYPVRHKIASDAIIYLLDCRLPKWHFFLLASSSSFFYYFLETVKG